MNFKLPISSNKINIVTNLPQSSPPLISSMKNKSKFNYHMLFKVNKKLVAVLLLVLLIGCIGGFFTLQKLKKAKTAEVLQGEGTTDLITNPVPKNFGYYFGAEDPSYLPKISDHSNVVIVQNTTELQRAKQYNLKSILILTGVFWHFDEQSKKLELKQNWQEEWSNKWKEIYPLYVGDLVALYPIDEPDISVSYEELILVLKKVKETMLSDNISLPLMTTLAPKTPEQIYLNKFVIPEEIDWIGFDEYNCFYGEQCYGGISYIDKLDWLIGKQQKKGKKVFVIFNGFTSSKSQTEPSIEIQKKINYFNQKIFSACLSRDEICIGGFVFLYPNKKDDYSNDYLIGVDKMPIVREELKILGQKIKNNLINNEIIMFGQNIANNKIITASNFHPGNEPELAFNNEIYDRGWNAEGWAPQWIEVDLGSPKQISGIKMYSLQTPNGGTKHLVYMGDSNKNYQLVTIFESYTLDYELFLEFFPQGIENIRYVKIVTEKSPSWVAWREIKIFGE